MSTLPRKENIYFDEDTNSAGEALVGNASLGHVLVVNEILSCVAPEKMPFVVSIQNIF